MTDVVAIPKLPWTFVKSDVGDTWACRNGPRTAVAFYTQEFRKAKTVGELIDRIKHDAADKGYPEPVNVEAFVNGLRAAASVIAAKAAPAPVTTVVRSLMPINEDDLKPRAWVIRNMLLRGQVSHYFGPGGTAKSLFSLAIAMACALGTPWLEYKPTCRVKTLIMNAEDDFNELQLRLWANGKKCGHGDKEKQLLDGYLHMVERSSFGLVQMNAQGQPERTAFYNELIAYIKDNDIGLLIVDPLISMSFGLDENSAIMQTLHDALRDIARLNNIPVLSVHHFKKGGESGSQDAGRGSSVFAAGARNVQTFVPMTEAQASKMLPEAERAFYWQYFNVQVAKSNHGPRGGNRWFKTVEIALPNGADGVPAIEAADLGLIDDGKSVLDAPWLPKFLSQIEQGRGDGDKFTATGKDECRADFILTNRFDVPPGQAKAAVKALVKAGRIALAEYKNSSRHTAAGYVVVSQPKEGGQDDIPF